MSLSDTESRSAGSNLVCGILSGEYPDALTRHPGTRPLPGNGNGKATHRIEVPIPSRIFCNTPTHAPSVYVRGCGAANEALYLHDTASLRTPARAEPNLS